MPRGKPTITADVYWRTDPDKNEIALEIEIAGHRFRELVLKLEDQALREALVALGWTPPAQDAERLTLVTECYRTSNERGEGQVSKCPICHKELPAPLPLQVWATCPGCGSEFRTVARSNEVYPTTGKRKRSNQEKEVA